MIKTLHHHALRICKQFVILNNRCKQFLWMGDVSNFPLTGFEWVEDLSQFKEDFIKNYDENSDMGYFLEVDVEYRKNLFNLRRDLPFFPERKKIEKCNKLICDFHCSHKSFKTSVKSRINTKKSTQNTSI